MSVGASASAYAVVIPSMALGSGAAREDDYARDVLGTYAITDAARAELRSWERETRGVLRDAFGREVDVRPAGSLAKDTLVRGAYDLDVVALFPADVRHRPDALYVQVLRALEHGFGKEVTRKRFALRVPVRRDFHVDVVPATRSRTRADRVYVHCERRAEDHGPRGFRMNLGREPAALAAQPGLRDVVRLLKIWKHQRGVPASTYYLELAALRELGNAPVGCLGCALRRVWRRLERCAHHAIPDPGNGANWVRAGVAADAYLLTAARQALAVPLDATLRPHT